MSFVAVVCGASDRWGAPGLTDDPETMLELLTSPEGNPRIPDATHLLILTRSSTAPQMRRLATLLQARDRAQYVAVLETSHTPLAMTLVAQEVNDLTDGPPGESLQLAVELLDQTTSGWWVRRPGSVDGAHPSIWHIFRSWFSKTGYLAAGSDPISVKLADETAWAAVGMGSKRVVVCGDVPVVPQQHHTALNAAPETYARELSWGGRSVVGQRSAFDWVVTDWPSRVIPLKASEGAKACDSCGAITASFCPFCHAHWGRLNYLQLAPAMSVTTGENS